MTGSDSNFLTVGLAIIAAVVVSFAGAVVLAASADDGINTMVYNANLTNVTDSLEDPVFVEESAIVSDCMFPNPGYRFLGWSESADGTGPAHYPGEEVASDMALFAYWVSDDVDPRAMLADAIAAYGAGPMGPFAMSSGYGNMAIATGPHDDPAHSQTIGVSIYMPSEAKAAYGTSVSMIETIISEYAKIGTTMTKISDAHGLDEGIGVFFSGTLMTVDGQLSPCTVAMYSGYHGGNMISVAYSMDVAGSFTLADVNALVDALAGVV